MRTKTAPISLTGRIRMLAWIEKDSVEMFHTSAPTPTPAPISEPVLESAPTPISPTSSGISDHPVVRDLVTCQTFANFRRMADGFRRQGRLVYGENKASFVHPDNCFVAVFSPEQRLIALVDTERKDLITGNKIENVEQYFAGNNFLWIQILNN